MTVNYETVLIGDITKDIVKAHEDYALENFFENLNLIVSADNKKLHEKTLFKDFRLAGTLTKDQTITFKFQKRLRKAL